MKTTIHNFVLEELNGQVKNLKKCNLPAYPKLAVQQYLLCLQPHQARAIFKIRTGVVDLKAVRHYQYEDTVCRLCNGHDEDIEHVVNTCPEITRTHTINNILTNDIKDLQEIASRYSEFTSKL